MNAFEYTSENLIDAFNRVDDARDGLSRICDFVRAMGMEGTNASYNLHAALGGMSAALADLDRRIMFAKEEGR